MKKNWIIVAYFPKAPNGKVMGSHARRECAEQEAIRYRRLLAQAKIEVMFDGGIENE